MLLLPFKIKELHQNIEIEYILQAQMEQESLESVSN